MKLSTLKFLCFAAAPSLVAGKDEPVEYGADVSFPMQYASVSTNYPWLEHNMDPSKPVPKEYQEMVPQPLGDKQSFYRDFLQGCKDHFGKKGARCTQNELDRVAMTLRQPQSMQNYVSSVFDLCWYKLGWTGGKTRMASLHRLIDRPLMLW